MCANPVPCVGRPVDVVRNRRQDLDTKEPLRDRTMVAQATGMPRARLSLDELATDSPSVLILPIHSGTPSDHPSAQRKPQEGDVEVRPEGRPPSRR